MTTPNIPVLLVIHPGAIGDVLLSLKAIRAIRSFFADHRVFLIARKDIGSLLYRCGEIDGTLSLEGSFLSALYGGFDSCRSLTLDLADRCTHAVCWMHDKDGKLTEVLKSLGVENILIRSPWDTCMISLHAEDRFLETLQTWDVHSSQPDQALALPDTCQEDIGLKLLKNVPVTSQGQWIVIHPGSGSLVKCRSSDVLEQVARELLVRTGRELVLCGGPADESPVRGLRDRLGDVDYHLVQDLELFTVAKVLARTALFIGHDSGLTHLAASLETPTLALFGPTDPSRWAPRGTHVCILRGGFCQCADWVEVQRCAAKPCLDISVDQIVLAATGLLHCQRHPSSLVSSEGSR